MITASKVELAARCPVAFALPQLEEKHAGQDEGNDRHSVLEADIKKGDIPATLTERWPDFIWRSEVAYAVNVATGEGRELGVAIGRAYPDLGPLWVYGTADIVGRGPCDELVICDRKSFDPNVSRAATNGQLHLLVLAACRTYALEQADVAIWHELRALDVNRVEAFDLDLYQHELGELVKATAAAREKFRAGLIAPTPGSHCRYCAAFHSCPAQTALTTQVANDEIATQVEMTMPFRDDAEAARVYDLWKKLGILQKRIGSALHARAAEKPIPLSNGKMFGPELAESNDKIDGDIAYEVIRTMHGQSVADAAVERKASKKRIKEALGLIAGKGQGAAMERRVLAEVKAKGGISNEMKTTICEYVPMLKAGGS